MNVRDYDRGALVAGVLFIVLGVAFLLDRLDVWTLPAGVVWALLLIGLGLAVIAGGGVRVRGDGG